MRRSSMTDEKNASSRYKQWAEQQLQDYQNRSPGSLFADGLSLTVEEGYQLQDAVSQLRLKQGDRLVGYKVGCTSTKIRAQLGITHCVSGRLYESEKHASGVQLSLSDFSNLAIEGELAVILDRTPNQSDFDETGIPACVSCIMPVIELHNHVMHASPPSAGELIASNAIHAGFVMGDSIERMPDMELTGLSILVDGHPLESCQGNQLIQTIQSSLQWLQESLRETGTQLRRGQIILTGSIPPLIPVKKECEVTIEVPTVGNSKATFVS